MSWQEQRTIRYGVPGYERLLKALIGYYATYKWKPAPSSEEVSNMSKTTSEEGDLSCCAHSRLQATEVGDREEDIKDMNKSIQAKRTRPLNFIKGKSSQMQLVIYKAARALRT